MSKIYTNLYASTGPSYTTPAPGNVHPSIAVAAGNIQVVAVPVPSEGRLVALRVVQTGGTSVAYAVDVLCSRKPYGDAAGAYASAYAVQSSLPLYRVLPQQAGTAGSVLEIYSGAGAQNNGFRYQNLDGDATKPERYLYLVIAPTSAGGTTTWDASVSVEHEMGL